LSNSASGSGTCSSSRCSVNSGSDLRSSLNSYWSTEGDGIGSNSSNDTCLSSINGSYITGNETSISDDLNSGATITWCSSDSGKGDITGCLANIFLVDLEGEENVSNDYFSVDDSVSLVQEVVWSQKMSVEIGVVDIDGSSGSNDVVEDSSCWGGERSSGEGDIIGTNDVDDPVGLEVAVRGREVSNCSKVRGSDLNVISVLSGNVTGDEHSGERACLNGIVVVGKFSALEGSVARESRIEESI